MGTIVGSILNPLSLTPALWIDFSDASTVSLSGSDITQVNDKSGNARHFTGTAGLRPTYQTAVQNGLNVARFDGSNDHLLLGSSNLGRNLAGLTTYIVRKWAAVPATGKVLFAISSNNSLNSRVILSGGAVSGKGRAGGRTLDADGFQSIDSTSSISAAAFSITSAVFDYANTDLFLYFNGTQEATSASYQSANATSNTAAAQSVIGANQSGAAQFADCDIAEILVFHSAHNAATRARVWAYLRTKWGI